MRKFVYVALLACLTPACGEEDTGSKGEGGSGANTDTDGSSSGTEPDCSGCSDDELCWYTVDFDDSVTTTCAAWPQWCDTDRTCDCLETQTDPDGQKFCDSIGAAQNTNACELVDERPVLFCETRLG